MPPPGPPPLEPPPPYQPQQPYPPGTPYPATPYQQSPYRPKPPKPNRWAFAIALPIGILTTAVFAGIQIPRSTEPAAYVMGQAMAWGVFPAIGIALLVFFLPSRVPWWLYAPGVVAAGAFLFAVSTLGPNADPTDSGRTEARAGLQLPTTSGDWDLVANSELEKQYEGRETELTETFGEGVEMVVGQYQHRKDQALTMGFVGLMSESGTELDDEIVESPKRAIRNQAAGAGVDDIDYFDSGPQGGALGCGTAEGGPSKGAILCVFAAPGRSGMTAFRPGTIALEEAAEVTRALRADVEVPE